MISFDCINPERWPNSRILPGISDNQQCHSDTDYKQGRWLLYKAYSQSDCLEAYVDKLSVVNR